MPVRKASAIWYGTLTEGNGTMRMATGAFEGPYSFASRFQEGPGTNPEELIAAAHAGCFSMALAGDLTAAGFPPQSVATTARVHVDKVDGGFAITTIDLLTEADVPNIDADTFQQIAEAAKAGCPVSKALAGVNITLSATLK